MMDETLPPVEIETGTAPSASVIWLHGLGADGHDFVPVVNQLDLRSLPPLRFVFPHAPLRPVTWNGGHVMPAWYDIIAIGPGAPEDEAGIRASARTVEALIAREHRRGITPRRIVLAGFSQGGAVALHTALRHPARLGGALVLSSYLPLAATLPAEASAANRDLPVFLAHGSRDDIVPLPLAEQTRRRLQELGYAVEWHVYPMAHGVCDEEIADIGAWLARLLV